MTESFNIFSLAASTAANFLSLIVSVLHEGLERKGPYYSLYSGSLDSTISLELSSNRIGGRGHSLLAIPILEVRLCGVLYCQYIHRAAHAGSSVVVYVPLKGFRQAFHLVYLILSSLLLVSESCRVLRLAVVYCMLRMK